MRLQSLEELLLASLQHKGDEPVKEEAASTPISTSEEKDRPGFTTIRTLTYMDDNLKFLISYEMLSYCHSGFLSRKPFLLDLELNSKLIS